MKGIMENKKGQIALVSIMIGIFVFVLTIIFINPIAQTITEARSPTQLNCSSALISDGAKATCLIVDLILPYFIAICLGVAGAWISAKML